MGNNLVAPLQGEIVGGFCVDNHDTVIHEDMIRISRQDTSTEITIACVIPPVGSVSLENTCAGLKRLINNKNSNPQRQFLSRESRLAYSLSESDSKKVLAVTYVLDYFGDLVLEEISVSSAKVTFRTYEEYDSTQDCDDGISDLIKVAKTKPGFHGFLKNDLHESLRKDSTSKVMIRLAMMLFNSTCRNAARKVGVPFIRPPNLDYGREYFEIGSGHSIFNCTLRNLTAFINASNLESYFVGAPVVYTEKFLRECLPQSLLK